MYGSMLVIPFKDGKIKPKDILTAINFSFWQDFFSRGSGKSEILLNPNKALIHHLPLFIIKALLTDGNP